MGLFEGPVVGEDCRDHGCDCKGIHSRRAARGSAMKKAEARQMKDCTFVPKVRKTKYLKNKARVGRFGEKDMAFLQTSSASLL